MPMQIAGTTHRSPTSHVFTHLSKLTQRKPVAADSAILGPFPWVVQGSGNDGGEICDRGEGHCAIFVILDENGSLVLKVDHGLEWFQILGCLVRIGHVVEEKSGLK
jgi:hypothetical protein